MTDDFKVGDHVEWNSEAGRVRGTIKKKINQERQDRPLGHAQRFGSRKDQ
jgi:hypothetical protein